MKKRLANFFLVLVILASSFSPIIGLAETNVVGQEMTSNASESLTNEQTSSTDSNYQSGSTETTEMSDSTSTTNSESTSSTSVSDSSTQDITESSSSTFDSTTEQTTSSSSEEDDIELKSAKGLPNLKLMVHIQTDGETEVPPASNVTGGTVGQAKRLEGMSLAIDPDSTELKGSIVYSTHVQTYGWDLGEKRDGEFSGTIGEAKRLEAVKINLTDELAEGYDIYYRVHSQTFGWLGWAKNGNEAGTSGFAKRLESIQIQLVEKGSPAPGSTDKPYVSTDNVTQPSLHLSSHVQTYGWQESQSSGLVSGGVTGEAKRLEAIQLRLDNNIYDGDIEYRAHVQSYGWQSYQTNGAIAGTANEAKRIEAIQIRLTGTLSQLFDVYYRVHIQSFGWLGWAKNDQMSGSVALSRRVEAIEVQLVQKGTAPPGDSTMPFISYETIETPSIHLSAHVQTFGWSTTINPGQASIGTVGQAKRLEAIQLSLENSPVTGGIEYRTHVQTYGWQGYQSNGSTAGTTGEAKRIEALQIRLTGNISLLYDIYYRVHSQTYGWLDWARNDQRAGTSSLAKRVESLEIKLVPKNQPAPGSTAKPYIEMQEFLFVMGHGGIDPGAVGSGTNERDFTRNELLPYLRKYANQLKESRINFYDVSRDMFTDTRNGQGAHLVSNAITSVTEFHLDSGGIGASGGHVIVRPGGSNSVNIGLANTIRTYIGWHPSFVNSNGLSFRQDLLNLNIFRSRGIEYRLMELGFISNPSDVARIRNNLDNIAKNIVQNVTGEKL